MKKNLLYMVSALIISTLAVGLFSSCDKDTDCTVSVTVIDATTSNPLSDINVKIFNESSTSDDIEVRGVTDQNGKFKADFKAPGLFSVVATRTTNLRDAITGVAKCNRDKNSVRLVDGETVECRVVLDTTVYTDYYDD